MPVAVPHRYHSIAEFWSRGPGCVRWPLLGEPTLSADVRKPCRSTFRVRHQARSAFSLRTDGIRSEFSRNGAGAGTVGNIRGALGLVLEQARRSGAIRTNPSPTPSPRGSLSRR